jgi:hypothetical protein
VGRRLVSGLRIWIPSVGEAIRLVLYHQGLDQTRIPKILLILIAQAAGQPALRLDSATVVASAMKSYWPSYILCRAAETQRRI